MLKLRHVRTPLCNMVGHLSSGWLVLGLCVQLTQSDNILAIFPYHTISLYLLVRPYIKTLAEKGHDLTVISGARHLAPIEGVHHIRIPLLDRMLDALSDFDIDIESPPGKWLEAVVGAHWYYNSSRYILEDSGVQALLRNKSAHFSMVILEAAHTDALYGFAQHFNAHLVGISAYGSAWNIDYLAGNSAPSVYEPMSPQGYTRGLSLLDKWHNWMYITEEWLVERLVYLPRQLRLYKQHFDFHPSTLYETRRNFSLILINQHFSLGRARSNVPNVVEIAGMHLYEDSQIMDKDLQRFLDEAEHGVIYMSMGIEIVVKWLPKSMQQTLLDTFSKLKQRVVWKYEPDLLPNKSDNVFIRSMLPQRQILNHPNVKLFISHAGLLSFIETVYYGIPVLCFPVYFDQFENAERLRLAGAALTLNIDSLNAELLMQSIQDLLQNSSYAKNAKILSAQFRDQPMNPLETAVWWTEYVLRHKGAPHMRLAEQNMSIMQYYSVDIFSVLFGRIGIAAFIVIILGYKLMKLLNFVLTPSHVGLSLPLLS